MRKHAVSLSLVLGFVIIVAGGCAKNEVAKNDGPIAAGITTVDPVKTEQLSEQPISQLPNEEGATHDALSQIANAGEPKSGLDEIYFEFDAYLLSSKARETLLKNAELLREEPAPVVRIEGHCDERGSDQYNLALGEKRARSAMQYLVTLGIPEKRISIISYGEEKPADPGHDEASWAKNRRDAFVIATE